MGNVIPKLSCLIAAAVTVQILSNQKLLAQSQAPSPSSAKILEKAGVGGDLEIVLREVVVVPGGEVPLHHHTVPGLIFIVDGTAESAYGNDIPTLYRSGETLQDKADVPHTIFRNADSKKSLRFLTFYSAPKGQPYLVTP